MDPVSVALVWRHCFVSSKCKARRGNLTKPESFLAFPNDRKDYSWVSSASAPSSLGWPKNVWHCFSGFDPVRLLWYWAEWKLKVGTIKMVKGWGLHVCVWGENGKHCFMPNTACCLFSLHSNISHQDSRIVQLVLVAKLKSDFTQNLIETIERWQTFLNLLETFTF